MEFKPRVVVTPKCVVKMEMEFCNSTYSIDEITQRIQMAIEFERGGDHFSELVVFLMRVISASSWNLKGVEVDESTKEKAV